MRYVHYTAQDTAIMLEQQNLYLPGLPERAALLPSGRMLLVADRGLDASIFLLEDAPPPELIEVASEIKPGELETMLNFQAIMFG